MRRVWAKRRSSRSLVVWLLIAAIGLGAAGGLLRLRLETTVESFLPSSDPSVGKMEQNASVFGGNPVVGLLESDQPHQLLTDQQQFGKLMKLEGELAKLPDVATVYGPGTVMNQIAISSQDMLARLSGTRDGLRAQAETDAHNKRLPESAVTAAGDAATAGFDQRYGALLVRGLPGGLPTTKNPNFIRNVIYDQAGKPRSRWHFVVPNAKSVAVLVRPRAGIDEAATRRLVNSVREAVHRSGLPTTKQTVTGVPAITAALSTEAIREIPLLGGLAVLVLLLRFLIAPAGSGWLRRLWPLVSAVIGSVLTLAVFGWTGIPMSVGAVVLFPLLLGIGSSFPLYLATTTNRRQVIVVASASAIAFLSLVVSPLPFVRELGFALALGVALTVSSAIVLERTFASMGRSTHANRRPSGSQSEYRVRPVSQRWLVLGCLAVVATFGWVMLPKLDVQANPESIANGLPELSQARHAEQVLGSSGEVNIVLRGTDVQSPQALAWMNRAQDVTVAKHGDQLRPILTAPDLLGFLGKSPSPEQISAGLQLLPRYLGNAVLSPNGQQGVLTFGMKFQNLSQQSPVLDDVRRVLPPPPPGTSAEVVGLPVAASRAYELISADRYAANLAGIVATGSVLLLLLRDRRDALYAVLAALLATGWMMAGLWVFGVPLNPLTVALGSLATVTACEFTVLLGRRHRQRADVPSRTVAWACLTSVIGYLALVPSHIALLREFGITLAITVLSSYLAALAVIEFGPRRITSGPARESRRTDANSDAQIHHNESAEVSS